MNIKLEKGRGKLCPYNWIPTCVGMTDIILLSHTREGGNPEGAGLGWLIHSLILVFHPLLKGDLEKSSLLKKGGGPGESLCKPQAITGREPDSGLRVKNGTWQLF